jgi:hypothetical protein
MARISTVVAALAVALCAAAPAYASPVGAGTSFRPQMTIRAPMIRPSIQPRMRVPTIGRQVEEQGAKKRKPRASAAKPAFGSGLRRPVFQPGTADARDRYANTETSHLLSRMPRGKSGPGGGAFKAPNDDSSAALLLPAVQAAREAYRPPPPPPSTDSGHNHADDDCMSCAP